jgi:signal transduction histidine kinase
MQNATIIWAMIASASLTMGVTHLFFWWQERAKIERLFAAISALTTTCYSFIELGMMKTADPAVFGTLFRWAHVPVWVFFCSTIGYIYFHLQTGRQWLAVMALGLRTLSLIINFLVTPNINYSVITSMKQVPFLGDVVFLPVGVTRPVVLLANLALVFLLLFIADASITAWRKGDKRQALMSGTITLWLALGTTQTIAILWLKAELPQAASPYIIATLLVGAFDLSLISKQAVTLRNTLKSTQENNRRDLAHLGRVATFSEISVNLAHEMNQPLGTILTNTQAAQRILAQTTPDLNEVREILKDIETEDLRASELIMRMRASLKRGDAELEQVHVHELIAGVMQMLRNLLRERSVVCTHELTAVTPTVEADAVQLQQVLINLILNAVEAMDMKPPEQRHLKITTRGGPQALQVSVTDSGLGLPENVEEIFQPYYTTKQHGLGMGLAICRAIVKGHHGQLWAEPNHDEGATFHFALSAAEKSS